MLKPMLTDTIGTTTARGCKIIQGIQTRITNKPTQACRFTDMQPITMKLCVGSQKYARECLTSQPTFTC